jgi:hypothetical protein
MADLYQRIVEIDQELIELVWYGRTNQRSERLPHPPVPPAVQAQRRGRPPSRGDLSALHKRPVSHLQHSQRDHQILIANCVPAKAD